MISHPNTSGRQRTVEFQILPSRTGQVRRIVSALLRYWELDALVEPAAVGVTELMANAHHHVEPDKPCAVEIVLRPDRLTFSVRDQGPAPVGPLDTGGRGPAATVPVGDDRAAPTRHDGTGKVVWFALPVPASDSSAEAPDGAADGATSGLLSREPLPAPEPPLAPEPSSGSEPPHRAPAPAVPAAPVSEQAPAEAVAPRS